MNDFLEQNRPLLLGGLLAICAGILALTAWRNPLAFDAFWHLQAGKDWLVNGLDPWHDHSSFTFNGAEITGPPYLFQAALFALVDWFGMPGGLQMMKALAFLLIAGCMLVYLKSLRAPAWVWLLVFPMLVLLIQLRPSVRPELLSFALSIVALWLYEMAGTRPRTAHLLGIVGLMWFWTNYHTAVVGYVIFAAFFLDYGLRLLSDRAPPGDWLRWFGWGLATLAVGFLNPSLEHVILGMLEFSPLWKELIQEYQSPLIYSNLVPLYLLLGMSGVTVVLSLRQKRFGFLLITAVLVYTALNIARMVAPAGIVMLCLFAAVATDTDWRTLTTRWPAPLRKVPALLIAATVLSTLATSFQVGRELLAHNIESEKRFPRKLTQYMIDQGKSGRIFNKMAVGGYLSYRLSPQVQVYIDGRTNILYPVEHYLHQLRALREPDVLRAELSRWDIDYIIEENHPNAERYMMDNSGFGLDFVSYRYLLFARDGAAFEQSGKLHVHPACWSDDLAPRLLHERQLGSEVLPQDVPYVQFLGLLGQFSEAEDRARYLSGIPTNVPFTDPIHRFIGFRAMELGLNEQAVAMFVAVQEKHVADYLAAVQAAIQSAEATGDRSLAERLWKETQAILPSKLFAFEQKLVNRLGAWFESGGPGDTIDWGTVIYCSAE